MSEQNSPIIEELHPTSPAPLDGPAVTTTASGKTPGGLPRSVWTVGGIMLLSIVGLGTALAVRSNSQPIDPNAEMTAAGPSAGPAKAGESNKALRNRSGAQTAGEQVADASTAPALCKHCGTVESVQSERRKGEGSGVGAVAGGVLGGLAGNQMGKGSGKTAMTVLGAVGGGFAGNAVEKNMKAYTVYHVKVRMADGSERTFTESTAPAVGSRVVVEGNHIKVDGSAPVNNTDQPA